METPGQQGELQASGQNNDVWRLCPFWSHPLPPTTSQGAKGPPGPRPGAPSQTERSPREAPVLCLSGSSPPSSPASGHEAYPRSYAHTLLPVPLQDLDEGPHSSFLVLGGLCRTHISPKSTHLFSIWAPSTDFRNLLSHYNPGLCKLPMLTVS